MRPLDPRLLKWADVTRSYLVVSVILGALTAVLIVIQAALLASIITSVFQRGAELAEIGDQTVLLAVVIAGRALLSYLQEWAAARTSARAKSQLRMAVLDHAVELGPLALQDRSTGELAQLTGRGIDALDAYFARYLPQLLLSVVVPIIIGVVVVTQDVLAAVIIALTLPLIPIFMILVGWYTRNRVDRQWRALAVLAGYFLDVVAGLPTLKIFDRARAQATTIRDVGERYRRATMRVLRVSFLSSLVLELLATLSVAIVAVSIGLRLVGGSMELQTALFVLILAPEAYLPLRMVGAQYHAAAEGIGAAAALLDILDSEPGSPAGSQPAPQPETVTVAGVNANYPGREVLALQGASCTLIAGQITAVLGPSGAGKSTLVQTLLGFLKPSAGTIRIESARARSTTRVSDLGNDSESIALDQIDPQSWLQQVAWLPQEPLIIAGTIRDNIALGDPEVQQARIVAAAESAGLSAALLEQPVAEGGLGISAGQLRRVGLARVLLREAPLVLLDEPSAALDSETEQQVVTAIKELRSAGRIVLVVAHRPALVAVADQVVRLQPAGELPTGAEPDKGVERPSTIPLPGLPS
ncbi:MAG: thiol reductant ABC exporter subunit CydD [Actinomycetia bacterium]|nr:thiol reductant ABC exporter subunit CydD [Actinomycetes bacterium]